MLLAIVYLVAITLAEVITLVLQPFWGINTLLWGIIGHILVFVVLIVNAAVDTRYPHRPLLLALSLAPLVRIMSLCMPLADIPQIWWYPIIYLPLLVATVLVMRILGYRPKQVGLATGRVWVQLLVALSGFGFGVAEYLILDPEPLIAELSWHLVWLPALVLLLSTGFVEEIMFRGVLQRAGLDAFGGRGIVYVSLLFAVLHVGFLSWIDVIFVFVVAMFFGWVVKKTGSLLGVTLSHGITNSMLYLVAPFLLG